MQTIDVLRLAQPRWRQFWPGVVLGLISSGSAVALLATSAYLITRAADQPPILYLSMAVVGVRAFALARAVFRYLERLASHDAAFRGLADLRVGIYERLLPLPPVALTGTRRGDLLARLVGDVDELQNLPLRVLQPLVTSLLVAVLAVAGVWLLLPAAGISLAVALALALLLGTLVNSWVAARADRSTSTLRADFADQTLDFVTRLDVLTAFGATDARLASLRHAESRLTRVSRRSAAGAGATAAVVSLLAGLATFAALVAGIPALGIAAAAVGGTAAGGGSGAGASSGVAGDPVAAFGGLIIGAGTAISGPTLAVLALVPIAVFEVFAMVPVAAGAWRRVRVSADRVATAVPDAALPRRSDRGARAGLEAALPGRSVVSPDTHPRTVDRSAGFDDSDSDDSAHVASVSVASVATMATTSGRASGVSGPVTSVEAGSSDRASAVSDHPTSVAASSNRVAAGPHEAPALELRHVSAQWPGGAARSLADVSVSIRSGERLLVSGPSGLGKTTLASVLARFVDYDGSVLVGGAELRDLPESRLRSTVGLCEQLPHLFDASLRQNLLFARDTATDADLLVVLDRVGLRDWTLARGGLDARLGERGALVSGGQAQRIALARVLLADFPVVIFDEPTANVDPERAALLLADLLAATGPARTVILISHTDVPSALVTRRLTLPAPAARPLSPPRAQHLFG